jgi:hypothetical protein
MSPVVEDTRHAGRRRPSSRPCWRRRRPWGSAGGGAGRRRPWATARAGGRRYCRRRPGSSAGSRAGSRWRATAQATVTASETAMAGAAAGWRRPRRPRRRETTPTSKAAGRRLVGCRGGRRRAATRGPGRRAARRSRAATRRRWRGTATATAWGCRGRETRRAGRAAWAARSAGPKDDDYDAAEDDVEKNGVADVEKDGGAGGSGRGRWRADRRKVEAGSKKKK